MSATIADGVVAEIHEANDGSRWITVEVDTVGRHDLDESEDAVLFAAFQSLIEERQ